jgi:hypothetical protein
MEQIIAVFQSEDKTPESNDCLKSMLRGLHRISAQVFNTLAVIPSGPEDFVLSNPRNLSKTSSLENSMSVKAVGFRGKSSFGLPATESLVKILEKDSAKILARSVFEKTL